MVPDVFNGTNATDQWSFDQTPGAAEKLRQHWDTYITEDDIAKIASYGMNALRIPIGYWAFSNSNTTYITGADEYLNRAVLWARNHGMKVWVDLHGAPGSQNGFDNSGHSGDVNWQTPANLDETIAVLEIIANKYGTSDFADVVAGIELVNEPISWGNNNWTLTQEWTKKAFVRVREAASNKNLRVVMHDSFTGAMSWLDISKSLNNNATLLEASFAVDSHLYQVFTDTDQNRTQEEHIRIACENAQQLSGSQNASLPVYIGEWSASTNICVQGNGTNFGGTSCNTTGCQCSASADMKDWNATLVQTVGRYVEAQLDTWETSSSGYFFWSYRGGGAWSLEEGIEYGVIPNPVTSRKYAKQC
ncbi:putative glucan 1,3-beta-glucosidase [Massarina eburnea CBS 473.64]|uniref:glucan 1,3-beta-glucosidase n=1 Tax=Massarina eburnea CBS 473.64 TaxID=1395130 RepID=A0A6A6SE82_9PLEO|nr:putative glucan 1,3-beta-glucosidase [Massarina eburnea CBS 473.64]